MSWFIGMSGTGNTILGRVEDTVRAQQAGLTEIELHQINAARALIESICKDNLDSGISISINGHHFDAPTTGGAFHASIAYRK